MEQKGFALSSSTKEFIKKELQRYESPRSAILPCLFEVQQKDAGGWLSDEAVRVVADEMHLPEAQVSEVFYFYTMFNKKPVGKYHVQVCCNVSCALGGARELVQKLCQKFNVKEGEVSACGRYSFSKVECLGSCDGAPMMQVNRMPYKENLNFDSAVEYLKNLP